MPPYLDLQQCVVNFLKYKENIESASPHTLRAYGRDLSQALTGIEKFQLPEFQTQVRSLLPKIQLRWSGLQASSKARKAATLKSFLGYLHQERLLDQDWSRQVQTPKRPSRLPHFLSIDEILSIMAELKRQEREGPSKLVFETKLLFLLLYGGGLRISEACHIRWEDIRPQERIIRILGKGNKERLVAFPEVVFELLRAEAPTLREHSYIWGEEALSSRKGYDLIRKLGQQSKLLHPIHPHVLRHSFATHLLSGGANLRSLQELLGHSSLTATQKYTQVSLDQLARTLEKHHPLKRSV